MGDDFGAYNKAFDAVFGPVQKLLCSFHVGQSWHRQLKKLVDAKVNAGLEERSVLVKKIVRLSSKELADSVDQFMEDNTLELIYLEAANDGLREFPD